MKQSCAIVRLSMFNIINCIICLFCEGVFINEENVIQHFLRTHWNFSSSSSSCIDCTAFGSEEELRQHIVTDHVKRFYPCDFCSRSYEDKQQLRSHVLISHNVQRGGAQIDLMEVASAFNRNVVTYRADFEADEYFSVQGVFSAAVMSLKSTIANYLRNKKLIRFSLIIHARYIQTNPADGSVKDRILLPLTSTSRVLLSGESRNIKRYLKQQLMECESHSDSFVGAGSGWTMEDIASIGMEIGKVRLAGGCRKEYIKTKLKGTLDPGPDDDSNECFFYAVAAGKAPKNVKKDICELQDWCSDFILKYMDTSKLKRPVHVHKISYFESRNRHLFIAINAYCYQPNGETFPIYRSKRRKQASNIINILLFPIYKEGVVFYHYVYIDNLNKLMRSEKNNWRIFVCSNCTLSYTTEIALTNHRALCLENNFQKLKYPQPGTKREFSSPNKQILQPIIGFLDFEACLSPFSQNECHLCKKLAEKRNKPVKKCTHKTKLVSEHIPTTYSLLLLDYKGKIIFSETHTSADIMADFYTTLNKLDKMLRQMAQQMRNTVITTDEEKKHFEEAQRCHLCNDLFDPYSYKYRKVLDHCHYDGAYVGPAHAECNWLRKSQTSTPIYIHNLVSYDSHFLIGGLKNLDKSKVSGIPHNLEKFKTLTIGQFQFLDSLQLLNGSLETLVESLSSGNHAFTILDQCLTKPVDKEFKQLLLRKGTFCYEFFTSLEVLKNTLEIPPKECFYSRLKACDISDSDYAHAKKTFSALKCDNMCDYMEYYCFLDTVLLAEVVSEFRRVVYEEARLDCSYYVSLPSLAFDCMLKTLDEPIELCSDPDMVLMFEAGIRGGVSYISNRRAVLTPEECEMPEMELNHNIIYLDANNLYSVGQSAPLPMGDYRWLHSSEYDSFDWVKLGEDVDRPEGYILEADIHYPESLHLSHDEFPMAPERKNITYSDLSPYSKECLQLFKGKSQMLRYTSEKLCGTLGTKTKYIVHYRNLALYLRHGLQLGKVHRVIGFRQKPFVKKFIERMTLKRAQAKTPFMSSVAKLQMNSVFGTFLLDRRKHMKVKFATSKKLCEKYMSDPCYKGHRILNDNLVAVYFHQKVVKMEQLYSVGFSILDISKQHMFMMWYDYLQPALGAENLSLILTDTDSLLIEVKKHTRREIWDKLESIMDFSNYPKGHSLYNDKRKNQPGFLKDETPGRIINEVVGLKSKTYIFSTLDGDCKSTAKGVSRSVKKNLTMDMYRGCLLKKQEISTKMMCFRSEKHVITTREVDKLALSSSDDKRFLNLCGIHSYAHHNNNINISYSENGVECAESVCNKCCDK